MSGMNLNVGIRGLKKGTNILEVNVPEKLRNKVATGVAWFDDALGGQGFTPSTSMMLTGGPGCGKTTMLLQIADAITKSGNVALLNTGEESLYQVKLVAERLRLKHGFVCGQDTLVSEVLGHADQLRKANPKKTVFLLQDSLQTLDDGKYADGTINGSTTLRSCEMLTDWAKNTYSVMMFIGQVNKDGEFSGKNQIKHAIDVHGHLYFDADKRSATFGERLFEVQKNRFGCNGKTYILGLDDKGLKERGHFAKGA